MNVEKQKRSENRKKSKKKSSIYLFLFVFSQRRFSRLGFRLLFNLKKELNEYIENAPFKKYSDKTIVTKKDLTKEIIEIKEKGYAITENEMGDGASAVSAPIKDYQGNVIAAVSIAGPSERMATLIPSIIPKVKKVAEELSIGL